MLSIEKLELFNFRGFADLELKLHPRLTLLTGVNGAGKTTILVAVAHVLRAVIHIVQTGKHPYYEMNDLDIKNGESSASIVAHFSGEGHIGIPGKRSGHKIPVGALSDFQFENDYVDRLRQQITDTKENCNLPVFAYYAVNRSVIDIPLRIRQDHKFELLETYLEAMDGAANFRHFFEWYRNREDLENEKFRDENTLFSEGSSREPLEDRQLRAVRQALKELLPEFSQFTVRRNPLRFEATKNGKLYQIDQLSDGEKGLIAMVGDLARRIAIANPVRENPLEGEGVVLIDEVDLHFHPAWQRMIVPGLLRVFPNLQFIMTTHSPQVLGEAEPECVRLLFRDEDGENRIVNPQQTRGLTSNEILDFIMKFDTAEERLSQNKKDRELFDQLYKLIDDGNYADADSLIHSIEQDFHGEVPELFKAKTILKMYRD